MKKTQAKVTAISVLTTFFLMLGYESTKELIFQGTLSPWQSHWITILFTTMLSFTVLLFTQNILLSFEYRARALQIKEEKIKILRRVMAVVNHNVNNLSNNLLLVELETEEKGSVSQRTLEQLRNNITDVTAVIQNLNATEEIYRNE